MGSCDTCCEEWRLDDDCNEDGDDVVNASAADIVSHSVATALAEKFMVEMSVSTGMIL